MLSGAHRETKSGGKRKGFTIYWRYGRGKGSITLGTFKGATLEEAYEQERLGIPELAEAWILRHRPSPATGTLHGMIHGFKASAHFRRLAQSTQAEWLRACDTIAADIGQLTRRQLEAPTATGLLIDWRDQYEATPRKADYLVTVLRAILKHARQRGWIAADPCRDITGLYRSDRAAIVWEAHEIETVCEGLGPDLARAIRFLWLTGLRRGDAVTARWDAIKDGLLTLQTGKSRGRTAHVVEIGPELQQLLDAAPRRAMTILSNSRGQPYTPNALTHALFDRLATIRKRHPDFAKGKRLHDMRGSRATEEVAAILADPTLRQRMGWTAGRTNAPGMYVDPVVAIASARAKRQKGGA